MSQKSQQFKNKAKDLWPGAKINENGWPATGGLWQCACSWIGSTLDTVEWRDQCYECPECGRRDLIQYVQALISVPCALLTEEENNG